MKPWRIDRYRGQSGITLVEVVIALSVAAVAMIGTITGYIVGANRVEWSSYSLAANALATMRIEQTRAAKWDTQAEIPIDQLVQDNFPVQITVLDIPISGSNVVYATNFTTVSTISLSPPLKMVRVDCVWPFRWRGPYTNTLVSLRAPDR